MKRIETIIEPDKVSDVCEALSRAGCSNIAVTSIEMRDNQHGWVRMVRAFSYREFALARSRVEVVAGDSLVDRVIQAIRSSAGTGSKGEIRIHDVAEVIAIGCAERSTAA